MLNSSICFPKPEISTVEAPKSKNSMSNLTRCSDRHAAELKTTSPDVALRYHFSKRQVRENRESQRQQDVEDANKHVMTRASMAGKRRELMQTLISSKPHDLLKSDDPAATGGFTLPPTKLVRKKSAKPSSVDSDITGVSSALVERLDKLDRSALSLEHTHNRIEYRLKKLRMAKPASAIDTKTVSHVAFDLTAASPLHELRAKIKANRDKAGLAIPESSTASLAGSRGVKRHERLVAVASHGQPDQMTRARERAMRRSRVSIMVQHRGVISKRRREEGLAEDLTEIDDGCRRLTTKVVKSDKKVVKRSGQAAKRSLVPAKAEAESKYAITSSGLSAATAVVPSVPRQSKRQHDFQLYKATIQNKLLSSKRSLTKPGRNSSARTRRSKSGAVGQARRSRPTMVSTSASARQSALAKGDRDDRILFEVENRGKLAKKKTNNNRGENAGRAAVLEKAAPPAVPAPRSTPLHHVVPLPLPLPLPLPVSLLESHSGVDASRDPIVNAPFDGSEELEELEVCPQCGTMLDDHSEEELDRCIALQEHAESMLLS